MKSLTEIIGGIKETVESEIGIREEETEVNENEIREKIRKLIEEEKGIPICGFLGYFDKEKKEIVIFSNVLKILCDELSEYIVKSGTDKKIKFAWRNFMWHLSMSTIRYILDSVPFSKDIKIEMRLQEFLKSEFEKIAENVVPKYNTIKTILFAHIYAHEVFGVEDEAKAHAYAFLSLPQELKLLFLVSSLTLPKNYKNWIEYINKIY